MENSTENSEPPAPKRRKYKKSNLKFTSKSERYKSNTFKQNEIKEQEEPGAVYNYYIRPFIPFWRIQQLNFETINSFDEIPNINENTYPRYVLHDLVQTWFGKNPEDKCWFDKETVYDVLKDDLILRIKSQLPSKTLHSRRHLILDCWMLYHYKYFQNDQNELALEHFPMWNSSKEFKYSLYVEVKRTSQDSPLKEFDGEKRLWWKVNDIDGDLYHQHYEPKEFNTDLKILSTEQYIPPFLKKCCGSTDEEHHDHEYVQDKPVIERPLAPTPKRNQFIKTSTTDEISGDPSHELNDIQIDGKIATSSELNGVGIIAEQKETIKSMESEIEILKKNYEETIEKLNEKGNQIKSLEKNYGKSHEELKLKENEIEKLKKKYGEAVEKGNESSRKLEQIETMLFGPIDKSVGLSEDDKQTLEICCEFINLNSMLRINLSTRIKSIKKKIKSMKSIEANSKILYQKLLPKLGDAKTNEERKEIKMIFKQKILDDQYKINSEKVIIRKMLGCDFKEEYRSVLTKMLRFCNWIAKEEEQVEHLDFEEDIFDLDIKTFFAGKGYNFRNMNVEPMNEDDEKLFAELFPL